MLEPVDISDGRRPYLCSVIYTAQLPLAAPGVGHIGLHIYVPPALWRTSVPSLDLHLAEVRVARLLLVSSRLLGALAYPIADLTFYDEVRRVGVVVHPVQLLGELDRLGQHLVVLRRPLRDVELHRVAQVHGEGYPVVVDARVEHDAAGVHVLAESVDAEGLYEVNHRYWETGGGVGLLAFTSTEHI